MMKRKEIIRSYVLISLLLLALCSGARGGQQDATEPGQVVSVATIHCIGIEWPIEGDANHNATCQVEYRRQGSTTWKKAMPLLRCDTDRQNCLAGSIFFLDAGTKYEVRLQLSDPDGGSQSRTFNEQTRPVPAMSTGGRTFHVTPGAGGGDGSAAAPFLGIAAAEQAAQPGDIFLLHAGDYGVVRLTRSGGPGSYIVWKAAGDGDAIIRGMAVQSYVWIEGLSFMTDPGSAVLENEHYTRYGITTGLTSLERGAASVCVTRCTFRNFHYCIALESGCNEWYIADNVIEGDNDPVTGGLSGEGIELNKTRGNVVAYNRITRVADGVSYPGSNCDIYGNEIHGVSDDGIETDMGQVNNRVWGNRITNACNNVFSFQPMNRGPWYFIRNQVVMSRGIIWKFVTANDRFVALHNTFVFPQLASQYAQCLLLSFSRNNLYIAHGDESPMLRGQWHPRKPGEPGLGFTPDWMTDVDYDGFDWGSMTEPFRWEGKAYKDLESFAAAVGIERHGVRVKKDEIFEAWTLPSSQANAPPVDMVLKKQSSAVDAGQVIPNINDDFAGKAPDLGALELGKPLPHYGPRPVALPAR